MFLLKDNFNPSSQRSSSRFFGIDSVFNSHEVSCNDNIHNYEGTFMENYATSGSSIHPMDVGNNNNGINSSNSSSSSRNHKDTNYDNNQMIFKLDEMFDQMNFHDDTSSDHSRSNSPPLGRLRREKPKPITSRQQVEFPGIFVEGFRAGHMGFNIPGILQDSLKPTDSMEVKINLPTPEFFSQSVWQNPSPFMMNLPQNENTSSDREACRSNANVNTGRFGASYLQSDIQHTTTTRTSSTVNNNNNNNDNTMPYSSSGVYFNSSHNCPRPGDPCLLNSIDTNQSDAHLLNCGTESYTVSSNPYSSSRFPSVCEGISTDSGLPSNCLVRSVISGHKKIGDNDDEDRVDGVDGGNNYAEHNRKTSNSTNRFSRFGHFDIR
ncbi:unnamed protein product [Trichobilharzia szidati]|nr:unnamed protein product [Trichobilharzia szidati]